MRDVEDGDALAAQPSEQRGERVGLVRRERRGRLVEDEHARLAVERLGDLDHLPPAERQVADRHRQRLVEADQLAHRVGAGGEGAVVDEAEAAGIGAEADVLGDRQLAGQAQFLLDDGDPGAARLGRRQLRYGPAVDLDGSPVGGERPRQEIDERRLAGPVLAEERVDAPRLERDRDLAQHGIAEERLRHAPRCERDGGGHGRAVAAGSDYYCSDRSFANSASSHGE